MCVCVCTWNPTSIPYIVMDKYTRIKNHKLMLCFRYQFSDTIFMWVPMNVHCVLCWFLFHLFFMASLKFMRTIAVGWKKEQNKKWIVRVIQNDRPRARAQRYCIRLLSLWERMRMKGGKENTLFQLWSAFNSIWKYEDNTDESIEAPNAQFAFSWTINNWAFSPWWL